MRPPPGGLTPRLGRWSGNSTAQGARKLAKQPINCRILRPFLPAVLRQRARCQLASTTLDARVCSTPPDAASITCRSPGRCPDGVVITSRRRPSGDQDCRETAASVTVCDVPSALMTRTPRDCFCWKAISVPSGDQIAGPTPGARVCSWLPSALTTMMLPPDTNTRLPPPGDQDGRSPLPMTTFWPVPSAYVVTM